MSTIKKRQPKQLIFVVEVKVIHSNGCYSDATISNTEQTPINANILTHDQYHTGPLTETTTAVTTNSLVGSAQTLVIVQEEDNVENADDIADQEGVTQIDSPQDKKRSDSPVSCYELKAK